jgi:thymidylate synthase (FAD)
VDILIIVLNVIKKQRNQKVKMSTEQVKLIAITQGAGELIDHSAQEVISYVARVSNPNNQLNFDTAAGLLRYCIANRHWSIFETAYMTLEINTTRAIAAQIIRHKSFCIQEFSQRYSDVSLLSEKAIIPDLRRQDTKNRQNSIDDIDKAVKDELQREIYEYFEKGRELYENLLAQGVAKESARFVLPLSTPTRLYLTGSCRSWITYIALREKSGTQKEHAEIAKACKKIFGEQFPSCYDALGREAEWNI